MKERQKKGVMGTWIQALSPDVTEEDLNCFFARSSWSKRINPMHPCKGLSCEHKEKIYSHSAIDGRTLCPGRLRKGRWDISTSKTSSMTRSWSRPHLCQVRS